MAPDHDLATCHNCWVSLKHSVPPVPGHPLSAADRPRTVPGDVEAISREYGDAWRRSGTFLHSQKILIIQADKRKVEKIFEITCTFADVMACLSHSRLRASGFDLGPQDYLKHLCTLIHGLPGGDTKFLPLLLAKIGQTLPSMLAPLSRHLSLPLTDSAPPEAETVSPAGFGNDWDKDFNWAEMSRIGDKTPELEGRLHFS